MSISHTVHHNNEIVKMYHFIHSNLAQRLREKEMSWSTRYEQQWRPKRKSRSSRLGRYRTSARSDVNP